MANIETGNNTAGLANVDANYDLMTTTPQVNTRYGGTAGAPNHVGAMRIFTENDAGVLTGTPFLQSPWTSYDQALQVGHTTPLMDYAFNGAAQDTSAWLCTFTTMTATQGSGFLNLNAGNIGTTGTGVFLSSKRFFNLTNNGGLRYSLVANITQAPQANAVWYSGFGTPASAILPPTDGVWFQYSSAGLIGVLAYNGTVVQTGELPVANPLTISPNTTHLFQFRLFDRSITFLYDGLVIGSLAIPDGQAIPFLTDALPVFLQQVNTGTVTGGTFMQFKIGAVSVDQIDSALSKPFPHIQAAKGLVAYQGQQGGTMGSTALYTNSLAPGAGAALVNATAAAGFTGLGGQHTYTPTLAANTDGLLSSYQNPAGTVNQTPRTMYITGVRIQSVVSSTLTGGPCIMLYSLAYGHTAVSLGTGESASFATGTTKAPRRIALGIEVIAANGAAGAVSSTPPVYMAFNSPVVVNPGEFVAIAAKNIGTVTSSGTITTLVTYDGYFE